LLDGAAADADAEDEAAPALVCDPEALPDSAAPGACFCFLLDEAAAGAEDEATSALTCDPEALSDSAAPGACFCFLLDEAASGAEDEAAPALACDPEALPDSSALDDSDPAISDEGRLSLASSGPAAEKRCLINANMEKIVIFYSLKNYEACHNICGII